MNESTIDTEALAASLAALKERAGYTPAQEAELRAALADPAVAQARLADMQLRQAMWARLSSQATGNRHQRRAARKGRR